MDRIKATTLCREQLDKFGLKNWGVGTTTDPKHSFLGICMSKDKKIILNAFHIDIHPDSEVIDTIMHDVAHAIVGTINGHNEVWQAKAKELGASTLPCSHLDLPAHVIDAIRSGQIVEMTIEEETHVLRRPKYTVTRLQDKCPECGKIAKELFAFEHVDKGGNTVKLITLECFHILKKVTPKGTPFETMVSNDWKPEVKNCKHNYPDRETSKRIKHPVNKCLKCQEYKLYPFQIIGARAAEVGLSQQKGFGIFDDMGLGKTVQGLAIPKFHLEYTPFLVVTKSAITYQWFKQIIRWLGPDYLPMIIRTSKDWIMPGLKAYIIPYDLLRRFPREKLFKLGIKLILLDECQQIKNPDSSRTQEVRKLVSNDPLTKVLPLSGTPWKNRGDEFFPVLNMMDPVKFYSHQHYLDTHVEYYYHGNKKKMGGIRNPVKFREFVSGLLIRREYNEVMDEFPDINRMKLNVQLDELQQSSYDEATSDFVKWYNEFVISGTEEQINSMEILAKLARMRHITGLAKIPATLGFVEEFVADTEKKLVIFVHHKDVGQLMFRALTNTDKATNPEWYELAASLKEENIKVFQYTSSHTGKPEGFEIQENFNKTPRCIMVASTLACGEGLDLQTCADTIMHERQWNPQNEDQAAPGRFRRIGQESSVINITVPEAEGTVDEHLDGIVEEKRMQYHVVMNKGEAPKWNENDIAKELAILIVAKHRERMKKMEALTGKEKPKTNITGMAAFQ